MVERIQIQLSEFDFDFQIFISPRITQCRIGLYNIMLIIALIYYILYLTLCIYDIFNNIYIVSHNHFTFFLMNIGALYTFFYRVCATFYTFFQAVLCRISNKGTICFPIFDALNHILFCQHLTPYHILLRLSYTF